MSETTQATVTEQPSAVSANWDALKELSDVVVSEPPKTEETPTETQNKDVQEEAKVQEVKETTETTEAKTETKEETKETTEPAKTETEEETATEPVLELKSDDVKDAPQTFEEGDWRAVAQDLGVSIKENSWEEFQNTFKEQFVPKAELEQVAQLSKEKLLAEFPPEIAAAIELASLGIDKALIFEPTKQIDGWLSLESAALVREDLKARGFSEDSIDAKIEQLIENDKLERDANLIREELKIAREQTLQQRTQLVQQKTQERERVLLQAKEQEFTQLKQVLDNKQDFMGINVSKDAKEAIVRKIQAGVYDKKFSSPEFKLNAILQEEFGAKIPEFIRTKAFNEGKMTEVKKLANVPPVKSPTAPAVKQSEAQSDNWAALRGGFSI